MEVVKAQTVELSKDLKKKKKEALSKSTPILSF